MIHLDSGFQPFATLHLQVEFPPQISSGTYEIRYTLVPDGTREEAPYIETDVRRAPGSDSFIVKIGTNTGWPSIMHRLTARADDHLRAIIVTNYFETKFINTPRGPDVFSNTTSFEMLYRMRLKRPVTRLVIIAEDSGGFKSSKTLVFRKSANRPSVGSSRFPKVD